MERTTKALRREQALLEFLLFRLVETRLLLAAAEMRFVPRATREVEQARQRACGADLARAAVLDRPVAHRAGTSGPTLRQLAATAGEPWAGMLRDHHDAMSGLVAEIELVAHQNAQLARDGLAQLEDGGATGPVRTATDEEGDRGGPAASGADDPTFSLVADRSAYGSVIGSADRLRMPALLAFLR